MSEELIKKTAEFVRVKLESDSSGHDWWHVYRVWQLAKEIAKKEDADLFIVELSVLLHEIDDRKVTGKQSSGSDNARKWMISLGLSSDIIKNVCGIIEKMSFSSELASGKMMGTKEGMVVRDADRLDGIGAIGIARCFTFGGSKNLPMYDPEKKPSLNISSGEYKNKKRENDTRINHFYEKLLLLKGLMNTETGRKIAEKRHKIMEEFLKEFFIEWEGNDLE